MRSSSGIKAFTLIETMMVIAVLAVLATAMFGYYKNVVENVQLKRAQNDLAIISKGVTQYKHIYGSWPDNIEQVVNASLVKIPDKGDYVRELRNSFGYKYSIEHDIRGYAISTKTKTRSGFESELRKRFTPPYKATRDQDTFFLLNLDRGGNYKSDHPEGVDPDVISPNVGLSKGMLGFGTGLDHGNPGGGVEYPITIPAFKSLTIEFWMELHDIPASYSGNNIIVYFEGIDVQNNTYPGNNPDPREVAVYVSGTDLCFQLLTFNASETANTTATTTKLFTLDIFSILGFPALPPTVEEKWNHFAMVYSNSNTESQVLFYINGKEYTPVDGTPAVDFFPMMYAGTYPKFENRLYIGEAPGWDSLDDAYLDNIHITARTKSELDFEP